MTTQPNCFGLIRRPPTASDVAAQRRLCQTYLASQRQAGNDVPTLELQALAPFVDQATLRTLLPAEQ